MASRDTICSQCGRPISELNQMFCGNCGTRLSSEPNPGSMVTVSAVPIDRMISFVGAIQFGFRRYFDFRGRSTRAEFWWWVLFTVIVVIGLTLVDVSLGTYDHEHDSGLLSGLFRLATLIPSLSVGARRLHDINRSGWWQLMWLIGWLIVPAVILIIWFCRKSNMQNDSMDA